MGCGSSGGVPRIYGDWGACDPKEPKNYRRRCSLLIQSYSESGTTNILIDTSPDLRGQLLDVGIQHLDAVLLTHEHADQTHGIGDLTPLVYRRGKSLPIWMNAETAEDIRLRFAYCFAPSNHLSCILEDNRIRDDYAPFRVEGAGGAVDIVPFIQFHGKIICCGFRIGGLVYSSDMSDLPQESRAIVQNCDTWIVDALRYKPHPTHSHLDKTLEYIKRLNVGRGVLTNLHIDMDYHVLKSQLPTHIEPAYDGMEITIA